jgi:hypothetical protein
MIYLQIEPHNVEPFKDFLVTKGWNVASQEGGQSNFIGWAYIIYLTKEIDGKQAESWLHYSENMSTQESHIELNVIAKEELTSLLKEFNEQL